MYTNEDVQQIDSCTTVHCTVDVKLGPLACHYK